jgi:hypothetical protein
MTHTIFDILWNISIYSPYNDVTDEVMCLNLFVILRFASRLSFYERTMHLTLDSTYKVSNVPVL